MSKFYLETPLPKKFTADIRKSRYSNGRISLSLVCNKTGMPLEMVTINFPQILIADNHVIIDVYTGINSDVLKRAVSRGLLSKPLFFARVRSRERDDLHSYPVCELLREPDSDD